jgi:hypothetical protein
VTRYFRSTPAVYASICSQLDAAYGYPNAETKTERTLPPTAELLMDGQGRVYLAIPAEYCDYILPGQMLPELLASGAVEEVAQAEYQALLSDRLDDDGSDDE